MARDTRTTRQKMRAERQETVREQLQSQGHIQHALVLIAKLEDAPGEEMDSVQVQRYRIALDARFRLIGKFLPDIKAIEHSGAIEQTHVISEDPMGEDEWKERYEEDLGSAVGASKSTH